MKETETITRAEELKRIRSEAGFKAHRTLVAKRLFAKRSTASKKGWETRKFVEV